MAAGKAFYFYFYFLIRKLLGVQPWIVLPDTHFDTIMVFSILKNIRHFYYRTVFFILTLLYSLRNEILYCKWHHKFSLSQ